MIDVLVICGDMADMPSALAAKQFRLLPRIILAGEFMHISFLQFDHCWRSDQIKKRMIKLPTLLVSWFRQFFRFMSNKKAILPYFSLPQIWIFSILGNRNRYLKQSRKRCRCNTCREPIVLPLFEFNNRKKFLNRTISPIYLYSNFRIALQNTISIFSDHNFLKYVSDSFGDFPANEQLMSQQSTMDSPISWEQLLILFHAPSKNCWAYTIWFVLSPEQVLQTHSLPRWIIYWWSFYLLRRILCWPQSEWILFCSASAETGEALFLSLSDKKDCL